MIPGRRSEAQGTGTIYPSYCQRVHLPGRVDSPWGPFEPPGRVWLRLTRSKHWVSRNLQLVSSEPSDIVLMVIIDSRTERSKGNCYLRLVRGVGCTVQPSHAQTKSRVNGEWICTCAVFDRCRLPSSYSYDSVPTVWFSIPSTLQASTILHLV